MNQRAGLGRWLFAQAGEATFDRPFSADLLVKSVRKRPKKEKRERHVSSAFFWNMQGGFFSQAWGVASADRLFFCSLVYLSASAKLKSIVYLRTDTSDDTAHTA